MSSFTNLSNRFLKSSHANPKAAGMRKGFFYIGSNYGTYERLTDDELTQWHPAFLEMGNTLDECADRYRNFCLKYRPPKKRAFQYHWGSRLLEGMEKPRRGREHYSAGQMRFSFDTRCQVSGSPEIAEVAQAFASANRATATFT